MPNLYQYFGLIKLVTNQKHIFIYISTAMSVTTRRMLLCVTKYSMRLRSSYMVIPLPHVHPAGAVSVPASSEIALLGIVNRQVISHAL